MVSPFGFSFASLRWGAMVPSFSALANQYSGFSFLLSFGPQAPCTPDFSSRSITESCAAANASIAAGVLIAELHAVLPVCAVRRWGHAPFRRAVGIHHGDARLHHVGGKRRVPE